MKRIIRLLFRENISKLILVKTYKDISQQGLIKSVEVMDENYDKGYMDFETSMSDEELKKWNLKLEHSGMSLDLKDILREERLGKPLDNKEENKFKQLLKRLIGE